jgi:ribonucleoside-diphosphate reductase alpha chain
MKQRRKINMSSQVKLDEIRGWDGLPTYSKDMYKERYFYGNEDYDRWLERVCSTYSDDEAHKERLKGYIKRYWFHPSTPVSSNAGIPTRGLPISCYTNEVEDSKAGIFSIWEENNWLGSFGGGIGTDWSNVRGIGEAIKGGGKSSGVIPFLKVSDATTLAVSQGGLRRASQAVYLNISHPEILEFLDIRRPTGDSERRCQNLHHAVTITDDFMEAMIRREQWEIKSPKTGKVVDVVDAFDLWKKILVTRMETGEPYIFFKDNANKNAPEEYKMHDREIKLSNLCTEIMLHTDSKRTGVCCLVSLNLEYVDEWSTDSKFIEDIHRFTDNVLQDFIDLTEDLPGFEKARKSAMEERSIGIGVMGYHSMLQKKGLPMNSLATKYLTEKVFNHIETELDKSNIKLGKEKGTAKISPTKRNVNVTAIAPTASISTLCNLTSPGIDPRISNIYVAKSNIGTYTIKNKYLEQLLEKYGKNSEEVWRDINAHDGSVAHLEWMNETDKEVFLTAFEIDQRAIIENVSIMQKHITQGISTNLFLPADVNVKYLYDVHVSAWVKGLKSLYYTRSKALKRAVIGNQNRIELEQDTCLSCA